MSMLGNNKCILHYGMEENDIKTIESFNYKLIKVTEDMTCMKLGELIEGYKFENLLNDTISEKVIIFNNLSDEELKSSIKHIRENIKNTILAVVTPTSINWTFDSLLKHLVQEREWYKNQQKGRA